MRLHSTNSRRQTRGTLLAWHLCSEAPKIEMRRWPALIPLLLLAACSKSNSPVPVAQTSATPAPATAAQTAPAPPQPASNPEPVAQPAADPPAPGTPPPAGAQSALLIPSGTALRVRLDTGVSTRRNQPGDEFTATLSRPIMVDGQIAVPAGARLRGHLTQSAASGRLEGRAVLALTLDSLRVEGREYPLRTSQVERMGAPHKKRNAFLIGGGAGLGAAIGAIAGGGAGTAGAAATGKEELTIPAEAALVFTTRAPVRM